MSATTRTFKSGNSQAVRLPKNFTYDDGVELVVERKGDVTTLYPKRLTPSQLADKLNAMPKPASVEKRAPPMPPKRPGL